MKRWLLSLLPLLTANWITLLGSIVTTTSAAAMLTIGIAMLLSVDTDQYKAALALLVFPSLFVLGLVVVALGYFVQRLRLRSKGSSVPDPLGDAVRSALSDDRVRRQIVFVAVATVANVAIVAVAATAATSYMNTPAFCGTLCHSVMQPEYDTYRESPHSRVDCVTCHIGPGASWAVKAKVDGLRQVLGVLTGNYSRPIPSPVAELRPARDTCEQCHWPAKFHGNSVAFRSHYANDEDNTQSTTALLLKIGGRDDRTGQFHGIHWHVSPDTEIRYEPLDERREKIGKVQVYSKGELVSEYLPAQPATGPSQEPRIMDCIDCHNRPTHVYDLNPSLAVDRLFDSGDLDKAVPFLHEVATAALTRAADAKIDRASADAWFMDQMAALYREGHPDKSVSDEALASAAASVAKLYRLNVYPDMGLTFGAHFNHLGHRGEDKDRRGCFRCHDDEHATGDGKKISQDCELCHGFLAMDEDPSGMAEPLKALLPQPPPKPQQ
jgi:nitrate/TMAO reductase-like tetraheme cytochrome c subunit